MKKMQSRLEELKAQHLPEGSVVLRNFEKLQNHSSNSFLSLLDGVSQIIAERDQEAYVISKITSKIFIESKLTGDVNIGILKNASTKIARELRAKS